MIQSFTIINYYGDIIKIDLDQPKQSGFIIKDVRGLGPTKANINTRDISVNDGSVFNSARLNQRNIVFDLIFSDTILGESIEEIRQKAYQYFSTKKSLEILVETDNKIVKTYGYVESNEPNIFSPQEGTQISILCPDPYFYATSENKAAYTSIVSLFHFPFAIDKNGVPLGEYISSRYVYLKNNGEKTGMTIRISGIGKETETTERLTIYNANTGAYMRLDAPIASGDIILITTHVGRKKCTLIRNGVETNYIGNLVLSEWLCVENGDNAFYISTKSGENNVQIEFSFTEAYLGV